MHEDVFLKKENLIKGEYLKIRIERGHRGSKRREINKSDNSVLYDPEFDIS